MLDVAAIQQENAALREQLAQSLASVSMLTEMVARLNERVGELLAIAQRKHRKPSPPKPPPSLEGEERLAFESRPKPPELPPKTKEKKPRNIGSTSPTRLAASSRRAVTRTESGNSTTPRPRSPEGRGFLSAMYVHEARAHELGLIGDALVEHRRRFIRPLTEQLRKWCAAVSPTLLPSER